MFCRVRLSIALDDSSRVSETAHTSVEGGDLRTILLTIACYFDSNRNHVEAQDHSSEPLYGEWLEIKA